MSPINRWINLHNIHACLYFGFSQNNLIRQSKLTKYVGNRHVSIKKGKKEENILFVNLFFSVHEENGLQHKSSWHWCLIMVLQRHNSFLHVLPNTLKPKCFYWLTFELWFLYE